MTTRGANDVAFSKTLQNGSIQKRRPHAEGKEALARVLYNEYYGTTKGPSYGRRPRLVVYHDSQMNNVFALLYTTNDSEAVAFRWNHISWDDFKQLKYAIRSDGRLVAFLPNKATLQDKPYAYESVLIERKLRANRPTQTSRILTLTKKASSKRSNANKK